MKCPKPSDYPNQIVVGDETWQIKFFRNKKGFKNTNGLCDPSDMTIYLKQGLPHHELMSTFLHEVLHAIETSYDHDIDHKTIYLLERALMDVLFSNF